MGIDIQTAKFLRSDYVRIGCFGNVLTLGPQDMWTGDNQNAETFFVSKCGAASVEAMDVRPGPGVHHVHDLNLPVHANLRERFDTVFDGGTLEHCWDYILALENAMSMVRSGGQLILATPANNFHGHGFWQASVDFMFRAFTQYWSGFIRPHVVLVEMGPFVRAYEAKDPAYAKRRPLFVSKYPVMMFVSAVKSEDPVPFVSLRHKMQSDYGALACGVASPAQAGQFDTLADPRFDKWKRAIRTKFPNFADFLQRLRMSTWNPELRLRDCESFQRIDL